MNFKIIFLNYLCVLVLYLFLYAVAGRINIALIAGNIICYLIGLVHYYVLLFRGTPILPTDFYAVGTAAAVFQNYEFKPNLLLFSTLFLLILLCIICKNIKDSVIESKKKMYLRLVMIIIVIAFTIISNSIFNKAGLSINLWQQRTGYKDNGVVVNFLMNMKYLKINKPEDYSVEEVNNIISEVNSKTAAEKSINTNKPNIIAIMNETFSDLSVIDDLNTNGDYMPFIRSLKEDTIKGNLFVSTFGGNTANTEWEFLTGNSMAFIPTGGIPYQQYIHEPSNSLAAALKGLGYKTTAIHPYEAKSWNRDRAYELLGFDEFLNIEDFENPELLRDAYISDAEDYKKIIKEYENKKENDRLFIFNVTIQNHGGYYTDNSLFKDSIYLKDYDYTDVNEYLSLIKESDEAFKGLVNYFSNQAEPTVVLMFGDHMPALDTRFYEELYKKPLNELSLEEIQKQYITPFVLWANYDIDEEYIDKISVNYLSTLLLNRINEPLTGYNKFLEETYKEFPVVNKNGYIDANGNYYTIEDLKDNKLINDYKLLQYNNIFNNKDAEKSFFTLNGR
jgi:phosphoglycerol transferase MdoB-like AlkP superfamily enzyme